jgi:hypothetical protein
MHAEWKNTQKKKRKEFSRRRRRLESYLTSSYRLFFFCVLEFCFVRLQFSVMSSSIAAPIENYIRGTSAKWNNGAEAKYHDGEDILLLRFGAWDSVPFFFEGSHFGSLKKQRGPNRNDLIRQRRCVVSLCEWDRTQNVHCIPTRRASAGT